MRQAALPVSVSVSSKLGLKSTVSLFRSDRISIAAG